MYAILDSEDNVVQRNIPSRKEAEVELCYYQKQHPFKLMYIADQVFNINSGKTFYIYDFNKGK